MPNDVAFQVTQGDSERIGRAYQEAAGIPAMLTTARYGLREIGPIRNARTLTDINQEKRSTRQLFGDGDRGLEAKSSHDTGVRA